MISPKSHSAEWIHAQRESLAGADPLILEKAIFALTLLDSLASTNLDFTFKGGTALLLHLPTPQRLSIDIDITCPEAQETVETILTQIIPTTPFTHWDEHERGERGLPGRRHYRFHYSSPTQNQDSHILLDVVTEPNALQHLEAKPIVTSFLDIETPVSVQTPKLESLLADKLTAFAPNTIGVPLTPRYSQQVLKQLFDIAQLYDHVAAIDILHEENLNSFQAESRYCNFQGTHHDYLNDLLDTAFRLCALDLRGAPTDQPENEQLLRRGIAQLSNHLLGAPFSLPQAKLAASKAACLATILKQGPSSQPDSLPSFTSDHLSILQDTTIAAPYSCLNRLKNFAPEVFYYWATTPLTSS